MPADQRSTERRTWEKKRGDNERETDVNTLNEGKEVEKRKHTCTCTEAFVAPGIVNGNLSAV